MDSGLHPHEKKGKKLKVENSRVMDTGDWECGIRGDFLFPFVKLLLWYYIFVCSCACSIFLSIISDLALSPREKSISLIYLKKRKI